MRKILFPAVALSLIAAPTLAMARSADSTPRAEKPVKTEKPAKTVKVKKHHKDKKAS